MNYLAIVNFPFFNKKGYFFSFDGALATLILSAGIFILLAISSSQPPQLQALNTARDMKEILTSTQLKSYIIPSNIVDINELISTGSIENTLIEQISEFHMRSALQPSYANNMTALARHIMQSSVPVQFSYDLDLVDLSTGNVIDLVTYELVPRSRTDLIIPMKSYVLTIFNQSEVVGPYLMELLIWS